MHLPICDRGAAAVGLLLLVCLAGRSASAGVVTPPLAAAPLVVDAPVMAGSVDGRSMDLLATLPSSSSHDSPAFWFPGFDDGTLADATLANVSLDSVAVRAVGAHGSGSPLAGAQQHPLIPLPPSAWTGIAGLLGLGAVKMLRNARHWLA